MKTSDKTTRKLINAGVLTVNRKRFPTQQPRSTRRPPYSFWSAVRYTFALSILLWWMPTFGQMIAGYVGGRRSGGPWKGVLAALIPVAIFLLVVGMADQGILTNEISFVANLPSYIGSGISTHVPILAPYIEFATIYVATFVESLSLTLQFGLNGYLVTVIFAYIGGIVSFQRRREKEFAGSGTPVRVSAPTRQTVAASVPSSQPTGWFEAHPESLESMKKIPVASRSKARMPKRVPPDSGKPTRRTKSKKMQKRPAASKKQEMVGKKLAERALRNYR